MSAPPTPQIPECQQSEPERHQPGPARRELGPAGWLGIVLFLSFLVYLPSVKNEYPWDDKQAVKAVDSLGPSLLSCGGHLERRSAGSSAPTARTNRPSERAEAAPRRAPAR